MERNEKFQHVMLWELKYMKNATKIVINISIVYAESVITDRQIRNLF